MVGILLLYNNFHRWPCQAIHTNHQKLECCTVILILSSKKTIRTLTQIVIQKGVQVIKSGISNYLMYNCQVFYKNVTNIKFCYRLSIFCQLMLCNIIKQVVPLKYTKILNISQYNHKLSTTNNIILLNLKEKRSKL